jgi:hypothetical protein
MTLTLIYGSAYCTSADADPTPTTRLSKGSPLIPASDGRKYRGELAGPGVVRGEGVAARVGAEGGVRGC